MKRLTFILAVMLGLNLKVSACSPGYNKTGGSETEQPDEPTPAPMQALQGRYSLFITGLPTIHTLSPPSFRHRQMPTSSGWNRPRRMLTTTPTLSVCP